MPNPGISRAAWRPEFFGSCALDLWADLVPGAGGTAIATWANAAPTGATGNFTQATGSQQPTIQRNVVNGRSGVLFDGVDDMLLGTAFAPAAGPCSIYTVFQQITLGGNCAIYNFSDNGGGFSFLETLNVGGYEPYSFASRFAGSSIPGLSTLSDASPHVLSIRFNNGPPDDIASYAMSLDGVSQTLTLGGAAGFSSGSALGARDSGILPWNGYLMRSLYLTENLSTANDAAVVTYLRNLYGI